ncbi:MAG: hypothetical protein OIN66_12160 [Candidatus Methanoperedens sp.]|nr:hypothetical protein [Candidatus Methanoperedens sp.]
MVDYAEELSEKSGSIIGKLQENNVKTEITDITKMLKECINTKRI